MKVDLLGSKTEEGVLLTPHNQDGYKSRLFLSDGEKPIFRYPLIVEELDKLVREDITDQDLLVKKVSRKLKCGCSLVKEVLDFVLATHVMKQQSENGTWPNQIPNQSSRTSQTSSAITKPHKSLLKSRKPKKPW